MLKGLDVYGYFKVILILFLIIKSFVLRWNFKVDLMVND